MAVPRTKVTKSKRGMRRSTDFLKSQAYVEDKSTGAVSYTHLTLPTTVSV